MSTSIYLSNPVITINSVSMTDQCTSAVVNYVYEQLETTIVWRHGTQVRRVNNHIVAKQHD
jgi:hypothetical protein